jgi:hypothetical protein
MPHRASSSAFSSSSASRASTAARAARSASSSDATGIPNTAITASPMNFSTVPPCRSSTRDTTSNQRPRIRRRSSASSVSPRCVDPAMSVNRTVTVLRISADGGGAPIRAPQRAQNCAPGSAA